MADIETNRAMNDDTILLIIYFDGNFLFICWLKLISHYNDNFITCYKTINGLYNFCFDCIIFDLTWTKNSINDNIFFIVMTCTQNAKIVHYGRHWDESCNEWRYDTINYLFWRQLSQCEIAPIWRLQKYVHFKLHTVAFWVHVIIIRKLLLQWQFYYINGL
jgi:hypothetical protein